MTTAIIDYESGNLRSAEKSFQRAAQEVKGGEIIVTADPEIARRAERIVLPGVGAFADCRKGLHAIEGMVEVLGAHRMAGKPFFGICVGMQLMATVGREYGETPGLDWISGAVERITPDDPGLKIPHMGWNALTLESEHPLFNGVSDGDHVYFVHSYHMKTEDAQHRLAYVDHGGEITAAIGEGCVFGTQFHPEKSQAIGLRIIGNFLTWEP